MNPRTNPYAPGAGTPPPELAGRDAIVRDAAIALYRIRAGRAARSVMLMGLRGAGKTVLLNRIALDAEADGIETCVIEAPEGRSLPSLLAPALRVPLLRLERRKTGLAKAGDVVERALRALGSFVQGMRLKYDDVEFRLDLGFEKGVADTGDLELDLTSLLTLVGEAAKARETAVVLFIDELQYVKESELGALITALHRCAQRQLPVTMVAAGLPQLTGQLGEAKSYAERMFEFAEVGSLDERYARQALEAPARELGVRYEPAALRAIYQQTLGYPYFLQMWGKHAWDVADKSPITAADVTQATRLALAELDAGFFRVRLDRLAPAEKQYLRAMAQLGPGPHRSGEVAAALGKSVRSVAPTRAKLIAKGMLYSPAHGDTAFTVPLFDAYMRRVMPFEPPVEEAQDAPLDSGR